MKSPTSSDSRVSVLIATRALFSTTLNQGRYLAAGLHTTYLDDRTLHHPSHIKAVLDATSLSASVPLSVQ